MPAGCWSHAGCTFYLELVGVLEAYHMDNYHRGCECRRNKHTLYITCSSIMFVVNFESLVTSGGIVIILQGLLSLSILNENKLWFTPSQEASVIHVAIRKPEWEKNVMAERATSNKPEPFTCDPPFFTVYYIQQVLLLSNVLNCSYYAFLIQPWLLCQMFTQRR